MKILHTVQSYWPAIGGMSEAVRRISQGLAQLGHEVHVATSVHPQRTALRDDGVHIHPFAIKGSMVHGFTGDLDLYRALVLNGGFDLIVNFAAQQWATDAILPILLKIPSRKVFVPTGFSGLFWPEFVDYFGKMPNWMRQYDLNIFLSEQCRDARFAAQHGIENYMVIPNGASREEFLRGNLPDFRALLNIPDEHFLVVHVGSHTGLKGHREAMAIFARARIRHATFVLIGDGVNPQCLASCSRRKVIYKMDPRQWRMDKRILMTELDRELTVAALRAADLFLFPSMIECSPLVLFECLAAQTPFLTTDVGNAREIVAATGAGRILPTRHFPDGLCRAEVREGAHCLEELWKAPLERGAMAARGHNVWLEKFTWEQIAGSYEQAYLGLLNRGVADSNAPVS